MKKVIVDANVCIDLLKVDLFEAFLRLEWGKYITDMVFTEVQEPNVQQVYDAIDENRLILVSIGGNEQNTINKIRHKYNGLSIPDCSCYHVAKEMALTVLTGEKQLTKIVKKDKIAAHGTLYIFEEMVKANIITTNRAHRKLTELMKKNSWLPIRECNRLLKKWEPKAVRMIRFRHKR
jgi:hypothetical protein